MDDIRSSRYVNLDDRLVEDVELPSGARRYFVRENGNSVPYRDVMSVVNLGNEVRHVLHAKQFSREWLEKVIFPGAIRIRKLMNAPGGREKLRQELAGRILLLHFYEASTRTRLSFQLAGIHLGMQVPHTENASEFSSAAKGETVEHSLRIISSYRPDVIVMRHKETGIVDRVAEVTKGVPVINGGDGKGQHPTQALLDIFTIFNEKKRVDGLNVVFGGDLKNGRTVRSLAYLLSKFDGVKISLVSHELFRIGDDIKDHFIEKGVEFVETDSVESAFAKADVIYWTRTQEERIDNELKAQIPQIKQQFSIGSRQMSWMKRDAILMHPMPIIWEIEPEVARDPRAAYFRQAENGLFVRMELLRWILAEERSHGQMQLRF